MRIVICDAHRVFADALASLLRAAGHDIAGSVLDLDEAAQLLGSEPIDACVIDLRAPDPGKRPEIERIVAPFPGTAFIALSGSADPSSLRHAMAAGVRGVGSGGFVPGVCQPVAADDGGCGRAVAAHRCLI